MIRHTQERESELKYLSTAFEGCLNGKHSLAFIKGEPGSGKSFVAHKFLSGLETRDDVIMGTGICNAKSGFGNPYLPFKEAMNDLIHSLSEKEALDPKKELANKGVRFAFKALLDNAPDLIDLFVPAGGLINKLGKYALEESGLKEKIDTWRTKTDQEPPVLNDAEISTQYVSFLKQLSSNYKVVIFIDDLQWADEASINLLFHISRHLETFPVFFLGTYRTSYEEVEKNGERHALAPVLNELKTIHGDISLDLNFENEEEKLQFLSSIIDREPNKLDDSFRKEFIKISNGNPLFVTELFKAMQESGKLYQNEAGEWEVSDNLVWDEMPVKVEAVVEERVERLETSMRSLLSQASAQGREFLLQVISQIEEINERELVRNFTRELAQKHQLVNELRPKRRNGKILSPFNFTNGLVQQYLYNDLGFSERMFLHDDIVKALETIYENEIDSVASLLAHHCEMADQPEKAVDYYELSAKHALRMSAFREASISYEKALTQNALLPDGEEKKHKRLKLLIQQSVALKQIDGWANKRVIDLYIEAKDLGIELNNVTETAPVLFGLWVVHLIHLELDDSLNDARELVELSEKNNDEGLLIKGSLSMCNTYYWLGDVENTKKYYDQALNIYDPEKHADLTFDFGQDPRSLAYQFKIMTLWLKGEESEALAELEKSYELMKALDHPFSFAILICTASWLAFHLEDIEMIRKFNTELREVSEKYEFTFYLGMAKMFEGYLLMTEGDYQGADQLIDEGYQKDFLASGGRLFNSVYVLIKGEVALNSEQYEEALVLVDEGLQVSNETGEKVYYSELLRLKALLLDRTGDNRNALSLLDEAEAFANEKGLTVLLGRVIKTRDQLSKT
ncbi:hypothetical protein BFP97_03430 [Roseivirga sp. 4D4]|uniref:ATP-binding protein n=1 Tax=Roseivirga sp. 4D4 TaxID=1889784 RepID=UPI0008538802|nr:AAA family ATPase [Roseivirga sp. 4D4]OEK00613.1 hypothetical protein BFP97_03430 [Roseivirga sp. 4D4]